MKKVLLSLLTIAVVGALITGGVMALFSDEETSGPNTFKAGTINLNIEGTTMGTSGFSIGNLKPGDEVWGTTTVKNIGSLDGWLYGRTTYTWLDPRSDPQDHNLANKLIVTWWNDPTPGFPGFNPSDPDNVTFKQLVDQTRPIAIPGYTGTWMAYGELLQGEDGFFDMRVLFDPTADNNYQKTSVTVTYEFVLFQNNLS